MKSFIFAAIFLFVALLGASSVVNALTAGASGSTSAVTAVLTTEDFYAGNKGQYYPFASDNTELATASQTSNIILVTRSTGLAKYAVQWNFTANETALVRTWLTGLAARNNIEVSFTATWNDVGRFPVETSGWTITQGSLFPFGITDTCDAPAMVNCLVQLELSLPSDCQNTMIPLVRSCAVARPECLAIYGKTLNYVYAYCVAQRSIIDTLFCTDGKAGGDAACEFVGNARPDGVASSSAVVTVDSNGFATVGTIGTAAPSSGSAGAVAASLVIAVSMILVSALLF